MQLAYDGASQGWKYECFHEHTILPFTHVEQSNSGGYGTIYRVRVHPDNHRGVESFQVRERASVCYAVKKLRSTDERDFLREFNILREVSRTPHANIVTILGSFRLGQDYHLVFPWADCDLSTFWRLNQKPEMDEKHVTWHVNLCLDIAKGLDFLHRSLSIVHGDIKPANILCFGKGEYPVAKIADLGSALVGVPRRKTVQPDEVLQTTPVYRAPECDLEPRKISRAVDIWSMGCIMLESVAWLVSGSAGLDKLADLRRDAWPGDPSRDAFFNYAESDGVLRAEVKPQILNVKLVLENMLTFRKEDDMFGRLSSHVLCEALSKIRRKMDRNDAYYEPRGSLDMVHSDRSTAGGQGANRKRASTSEVSATRENKTKRKMTDETDMNDGLTDRFVLREKFACPFWKAGVDKVFLNRACAGPGWDEVHRVKEHIRRCHTPSSFKNPYVCGRCLENFGSQERLMQHGREEIQCIIRAPEIIHGKITLEQAINLRSTKKKAPDMTDEEKWFDWFSILLPAHPLPLSPYYDDATSSTLNTLSTQHSTGISEYEEYLHIPLDDEKQKDLEEDIGGALGITNTAMCRILATKFREYQLRDVQKFNQDKLKPTYEIPALSNDLEKEHDYVSDVGATVSAELDIALAEWLA
ncbi:kinase-like domain-containing protein [Podospora didyma]|uniref:Kinase-like domain-containing protein n=1 Tax=Podospora didyma TaxID=330526 RepID=A0AAE0NGU6_9PEZI|nr:kinase-like domain-containing protein [Podospora didyma]